MQRTWGLLTLAVATLAAAVVLAAAGEQLVTGTASYRERIALPPGAVFEAVLEDVTDGDAPVVELGRATIEDPGAPPFEFEIAYDPTAVDPSHAYSVRTQISIGRRLMFVSEAAHPVLTAGAGSQVVSWMIKVGDTGEEGRDAPVQIGAHGLRLPASFLGELPCADCDGIRYRLNLWPDQVFHLRRVWIGKDKRADTIGRWSVHPDPRALVLTGPHEVPQFQILGADRLRPLGADGAAVDPDGAYDLAAADEFEEFEPHLPLRGMLTWVGDAARFTECLTGRDYPLVAEGDYAALEHAYLAAGAESAGPIMASVDGGIVREPGPSGEEPALLVERFVGVWPGETCERADGAASLTNTYWKILRLGDTEVGAAEGAREPNLILRAGAPHFTATVGCNQLMGSFELDGDRLKFGPAGMTMMACPAPLDGWEKRLGEVLAATAGWRIDGQTLELVDAAEEPLALFQAVYLY